MNFVLRYHDRYDFVNYNDGQCEAKPERLRGLTCSAAKNIVLKQATIDLQKPSRNILLKFLLELKWFTVLIS